MEEEINQLNFSLKNSGNEITSRQYQIDELLNSVVKIFSNADDNKQLKCQKSGQNRSLFIDSNTSECAKKINRESEDEYFSPRILENEKSRTKSKLTKLILLYLIDPIKKRN